MLPLPGAVCSRTCGSLRRPSSVRCGTGRRHRLLLARLADLVVASTDLGGACFFARRAPHAATVLLATDTAPAGSRGRDAGGAPARCRPAPVGRDQPTGGGGGWGVGACEASDDISRVGREGGLRTRTLAWDRPTPLPAITGQLIVPPFAEEAAARAVCSDPRSCPRARRLVEGYARSSRVT